MCVCVDGWKRRENLPRINTDERNDRGSTSKEAGVLFCFSSQENRQHNSQKRNHSSQQYSIGARRRVDVCCRADTLGDTRGRLMAG